MYHFYQTDDELITNWQRCFLHFHPREGAGGGQGETQINYYYRLLAIARFDVSVPRRFEKKINGHWQRWIHPSRGPAPLPLRFQ